MKIKENYKVREIAGEHLIVEQGQLNGDMTKVISLNATAVLLWNELQGKEFALEDAAAVLEARYGIAHEQAMTDAGRWTEALLKCGVMEG